MIYIFEGLDNCLKDTLIKQLKKYLGPKTQVLKYSGPPDKCCKIKEYQQTLFTDMFDLMKESLTTDPKRNLILNRAHLGEYVYAPIYRDYPGDWIFDIEEEKIDPYLDANTKVILLYDTDLKELKKREDGLSLSSAQSDKLKIEISSFKSAHSRSRYSRKLEFDLSSYYEGFTESDRKKVNTTKILEEIWGDTLPDCKHKKYGKTRKS